MNTNTILIATAARPMTQAKADAFNEIVRNSAKEADMTIPQGIWWTHGSYCANLAFDIQGGTDEDHTRFANALTMHLQPAKWEFTTDRTPRRDQYDFDD